MARERNKDIAILGAGNWGTTLAVMLGGQGWNIRLWEYRPELANQIQVFRENRVFLPGIRLPEKVITTSALDQVLTGAHAVIIAVPSSKVREVCQSAVRYFEQDVLVISGVKGLETSSLLRMSQVLVEFLSQKKPKIAALSGPNIASEIALGMPATAVVASEQTEIALEAQSLLHSERYRIYTSQDLVGVELGGALKNIIALAAGMVEGLGLGANTMGALLTRGLAEITRLGLTLGARPETFSGLSGLGDLVATCMSERSRNRQVGLLIGKGQRLAEVLQNMTMVAEGVPTTKSAWELSLKQGVEMPITRAVHQILFEDKPPRDAIAELMAREAKAE